MADTGCQSCLAGINVMQKIGLQEKDLVPVRMSMRAANERDIHILGAIIVKLSCTSEQGKLYNTRQLLYITNATDKVFLSREACIDLRLISKKFPTVGEQDNTMCCEDNALHSANSDIICNCPRRQMPPPMPSSLPYPATEANRKNLESYLLEYYKASTFNVCQHQKLPKMEGPPMRIMIDNDAKPVAHHTPVPVPLHWQDEVKAGLDQDVLLGVIEPVPIGEPVTWCHRMVICAKKTVNLAGQSTSSN